MKEGIQKFKDREINLEQAFEELSKEGFCPNLLNDDNGHWAVVFDGYQTVPMGEEPCDIETSFFVEADSWKDSIYEAVLYALNDGFF